MSDLDGVIQEHGATLLAYATRLTGDRHLAEDVVQETWLRAWRHVDRLTEDLGSVRGWLLRVTRNVAIDLHRGRRARPTEVGLPEQGLDGVAVLSVPSDDVETRMVVDAALDHLTPAHRTTVVAVYFADRTAKSAASVLGVPVGTVKSRLHNAIRTLRDQLTPARLAA